MTCAVGTEVSSYMTCGWPWISSSLWAGFWFLDPEWLTSLCAPWFRLQHHLHRSEGPPQAESMPACCVLHKQVRKSLVGKSFRVTQLQKSSFSLPHLLVQAVTWSVSAVPARRCPPCHCHWGWFSAPLSCARALQHPRHAPNPEAAQFPDLHWGRCCCSLRYSDHTVGARRNQRGSEFSSWVFWTLTRQSGSTKKNIQLQTVQCLVPLTYRLVV